MDPRRMLISAGFGWLAGMRSLAGPTFASYRLHGPRAHPRGPLAKALGGRSAPYVLSALALGEAAVDKWPGAPARTAPPSLGARALLGALAGAAVAEPSWPSSSRRSARWAGAAVGAAAAVASTYAMLWLRRRAAEASGISIQRVGLAEDALAVGVGTALARA